MPVAAYFDDYCMVEPTWCRSTAKDALRVVHRLMGMSLATGPKDIPFRFKNCFLGVITDFSRFHREGVVVVQSKPMRVAKAIVRITEFLAAGTMRQTDAGSLAQKLEYTTASGANGRIGRAALAALRAHQYGDTEDIEDPLAEALRFFLQLLPLLPPRILRFRKRKRRPIVVYTDAMYTPGAAIPAQVGVVIYDPEAPVFHPPMANDDACDYRWRHTSAVVSPEQLDAFRPREQYIGQLEALAAVLAYSSHPDQFRDRDVIHFIDNTGAVMGIAKGYSRDIDSARLIHFFHSIACAIGVNSWFEYVASGANISDLPSRGEFEKLNELGSVFFEPVWPPLGASWAATFAAAYEAYAPRPSRATLRFKREVQSAIESIRSFAA